VADVAPHDADRPVATAATDAADDPAEPTRPIETPAYTGRASAKVQPNGGRLLDDATENEVTEYDLTPSDGGNRPGPTQARGPLIIGAVIAALIAVAVISIVRLTAHAGCPAAGCAAGPSGSSRAAIRPTTTTTVAPPADAGEGRVAPGSAPPLASVMPADIGLPACRTTDDDPFLTGVSTYFACQEGATAPLPYLQVWGYQFADQTAYVRGVDAFNAFVKFDPAAAEGKCPPAATYGRVGWHTTTAPDVEAGTLECYSDSSENHYYVWTDDAERTILVAESSPDQTFAELDAWWRQNNRNA
jgi:hypothetical protein